MDGHLKHIDIKNFKCFKNFKVKSLARVNLITGQNNVGKTAFLEALHTHSNAQTLPLFFASLRDIKYRRENINILSESKNEDRIAYLEQTDGFDVSSNIYQTRFDIDTNNGVKTYNFKFNDEVINVNSNKFSHEKGHSLDNIFIDNFGMADDEIIELFSSVQKLDKESYLNEELNKFDNNITKFKVTNNQPHCQINGQYLKLTELGDGTKHLVSLIATLFTAKDGYVFIDEIDNGVHYTKMDDLWEIILTLSNEKNIQVFATTHSKECLESYVRVAKKLEDKGISLIELGSSDGELKSVVFDYDRVIKDISKGFEVRGWES